MTIKCNNRLLLMIREACLKLSYSFIRGGLDSNDPGPEAFMAAFIAAFFELSLDPEKYSTSVVLVHIPLH